MKCLTLTHPVTLTNPVTLTHPVTLTNPVSEWYLSDGPTLRKRYSNLVTTADWCVGRGTSLAIIQQLSVCTLWVESKSGQGFEI